MRVGWYRNGDISAVVGENRKWTARIEHAGEAVLGVPRWKGINHNGVGGGIILTVINE